MLRYTYIACIVFVLVHCYVIYVCYASTMCTQGSRMFQSVTVRDVGGVRAIEIEE
jgi:hypothetical protein